MSDITLSSAHFVPRPHPLPAQVCKGCIPRKQQNISTWNGNHESRGGALRDTPEEPWLRTVWEWLCHHNAPARACAFSLTPPGLVTSLNSSHLHVAADIPIRYS